MAVFSPDARAVMNAVRDTPHTSQNSEVWYPGFNSGCIAISLRPHGTLSGLRSGSTRRAIRILRLAPRRSVLALALLTRLRNRHNGTRRRRVRRHVDEAQALHSVQELQHALMGGVDAALAIPKFMGAVRVFLMRISQATFVSRVDCHI